MANDPPQGPRKFSSRKTFYGLAGLIAAIVSVLFLAAAFVITAIDISPHTFDRLNNLTYLLYCITTPFALGLAIWGITRENDSTNLSVAAIALAGLPILILFYQFVTALIRDN